MFVSYFVINKASYFDNKKFMDLFPPASTCRSVCLFYFYGI